MKKILLASVGVLALGIASASAADIARRPMPGKAPVYVTPAYNWTGFYVGINGGGAFGDVKIARSGFAGDTETRAGWTAGAGVEVAINGPWTAKVEYLYADLGTANCSAANCGISTNADVTANIVRGGVNYRF